MSRLLQKVGYSLVMLSIITRAYAELIFYDQAAGIEVSSASTLEIAATALRPIDGTIVRASGGAVIGNKFFFNSGILSDGDFDAILTATFDPNNSFSILLSGTTGGGTASFFVTNPGRVPYKIKIRGVNNRIEGLPSFVNPESITLADRVSTVTLALQKELNQSIQLNRGNLVLDDDLHFNDYVKINGTGNVFFNGNNLSFGTRSLVWTDTVLWVNGQNLILNGDSVIDSWWAFKGDAQVIGNNNVIDLTTGGTILIKKNTTVLLTNLTLLGLGQGFIVFEDKTSRLELFGCKVEMSTDYTFTTGGLYISGESTIVTRDNLLIFDQKAALTVDGTTLFYDTLDFKDTDNIRTFTQRSTNNYGFLNGGSIRYKSSPKIGDENFNGDTFLDRALSISKKRKLIIHTDSHIDGRSQTISFARQVTEPLVIIESGSMLKFTDVLLQDFPVNNAELKPGAQLIFGDGTTLELAENSIINSAYEFEGNVFLNGKNKTLIMGPNGKLIWRPGAQVTLDNIKLKGIHSGNIILYDNTCTMSLIDVEWTQDAAYSFTRGQFEVLGSWDLRGTETFSMATSLPCTVRPLGIISIGAGPTFLYAPPVANRDLLKFVNSDAQLYLNGGTFASTTTGARLTKGTLVIDSKSFMRNDGAISLSEGIAIGDGTLANDLGIKVEPAATLEIISGLFVYQNVG